MKIDLDKKEIVFNNSEAQFLNELNNLKESDNLITLSVYWDETMFSQFLVKYLKFGFRGNMMDTECYVVPDNFEGVTLEKLSFSDVVTVCGFNQSTYDFADLNTGYNEAYKIK